MAAHFKTGGRKRGTPNKKTLDAAERLAALGCDPLEGMARIAMSEDAELPLRGRMYIELAQYLYPKRKAVDVAVSANPTIEDLLAQLDAPYPA